MKLFIDIKKYFAVGLGASALALGSPLTTAATFELCAGAFPKTMADGVSVTMWGFAPGGVTATGACAAVPTVPGPEMDTNTDLLLDVTLHNTLSVPVSLIIPGQSLPTNGGVVTAPVYDNPAATDRSRRVRSLVHEAAPGGSAVYNWASVKPGSHLYHSATHQQVQVQMGLYGAMIRDAGPGEAYAGVLYDSTVSLYYSEVDPALHQAVASNCFGSILVADPTCNGVAKPAWMSSTREYHPRYFLVNGAASDGSLPIIAGQVGQNILIRFFNAGLISHMPQSLNHMIQVAENGYPLTVTRNQLAVSLQALMTADVIMSPTVEGTVAVFDRRLRLSDGSTNNGLMSKLNVLASTGLPPGVPTAGNDSGTTTEDAAVEIALTANDSADALNGRTLNLASIVIRSLPGHGSVVAGPTLGSVTYTPVANYAGADLFTYTIADSAGSLSNVATVNVTVSAVNDAPVALADAYNAEVGRVLNVAANGVLANDTDLDGPALSVASADVTSLLGGSVIVAADGSVTYTPPASAVDGVVDSFAYVVTDGTLTSGATVSVTLHVYPPTANADSLVTAEDSVATVNVLANDTAGTFAIDPASVVATSGTNGTTTVDALGNVTYTPAANFFGVDQFSYTVSDSNIPAKVSTAAVVNVTINAVNDAPVAVADSYSVPAFIGVVTYPDAQGLLANDSDLENSPLTIGSLITTGTLGTVVLNGTKGGFSYSPAAGAVAGSRDSFSYTASDGSLTSAPAVVTIIITAAVPTVNVPPVAVQDTIRYSRVTNGGTNGHNPLTFPQSLLTANDTDPDDPTFQTNPNVTVRLIGGPSTTIGLTSRAVAGSGIVYNTATKTLTYTPYAGNLRQNDSFKYQVVDARGGVSATVTVIVRFIP